ncbi:MAG: hypothetical protein ACT6FF_07670, partial [Methanosarcinaceae archaeon]
MIYQMVIKAYSSAKKVEFSGSEKEINSARSKRWIENLADELKLQYSTPDYRVFSSGNDENRASFKINELLFDISVVKIGTIASASKRKDLEYVECSEWQIESEFHKHDSRASIIDFSKLVMGSAKNKLLILPESKAISSWALNELIKAIPADGTNYYLAFVRHPSEWLTSSVLPRVFIFENRTWQ